MSIRTYIFVLLTSLVLLISALLSFQSAKLFIGAFQMASEDFMYELGQHYPENSLTEQVVLDYHITTDWAAVPAQIRAHFPTKPLQNDELNTEFVDWNYISPPNHIYSLMMTIRDDKQVFVSRYKENIHQEIKDEHSDEMFIDPMLAIIIIGIVFTVIFVITLLIVFRKVAKPMESLQQWASQLTIDKLSRPKPDFRFRELNSLATLMHKNLSAMAESVEREQRFLSYASHELRTPIAVIRSNCSLLEKVNNEPTAKERVIRQRINRASLTMKSMTETLLWLSRDNEFDMPLEKVDLTALIRQAVFDLDYLLSGKEITISLNLDEHILTLPLTPTSLIINNLIRNAFQHTQSGDIVIDQHEQSLSITNHYEMRKNGSDNQELGFGLGTQLISNLIEKFSWHHQIEVINDCYKVSVSFSSTKSSGV